MVIHLWGGIESDRNIKNNIKAFGILNDIAIKYGVELMVENVVCNRQNPMKHLHELSMNYPNISFTFDTKMAAFHEQIDLIYEDEWKWIWEKGHIKHIHVNDYNGGYMDWGNLKAVHIGEGKVDFGKFFDFVSHVGYLGDYTIEAPSLNQDGEVDFDKLNNSIRLLRSYI